MVLSLSLSRVKRQKWVPIALIGLGVAMYGVPGAGCKCDTSQTLQGEVIVYYQGC